MLHTSMLRKLGPEGGLVPSSAGWALVPQAGGFLPGPLPRLPCTSIGALLRTNWLRGMRRELLSVLSVGDSSSGSAPAAVLLMDLLLPEDMPEIACAEQSPAESHFGAMRPGEGVSGHPACSGHFKHLTQSTNPRTGGACKQGAATQQAMSQRASACGQGHVQAPSSILLNAEPGSQQPPGPVWLSLERASVC